jgi:glycosyltransferase involved in cell wall biosynthesis
VNVVFVSHCDFTGNSALHVLAVASGLHERGVSPVIAVPSNAGTVDDVGRPSFPVLTYEQACTGALSFPDGRGPDLVHCFTPREIVRRPAAELVRLHGCPYVVHLEDNEEVVTSVELRNLPFALLRLVPRPLLDRLIGSRFHPIEGPRFLDGAAGVTVIVARLLELVPTAVPAAVVGAGFDEAVLSPQRSRDDVRTELGLTPDDLAIVYTGSVHRVNLPDMRDLYTAVAMLRHDGRPVVLVKTGTNTPEHPDLPALGEGLRDLGWVARDAVPDLLNAADILVQPGRPGRYNDYRLPSKLPDFLASGKPVILPRANIGLALEDGHDAVVLGKGDVDEIGGAVARLADDSELRASIGANGRAFALRELRWSRVADRIAALHRELATFTGLGRQHRTVGSGPGDPG